MSDDRKQEAVIPSLRTPRERVVDHLRTALSVGVASVLVTGTTSCIVADPPPPASVCVSGDPVANVRATIAVRAGSGVELNLSSLDPTMRPSGASPLILSGGQITQHLTSGGVSTTTIEPSGGVIELRASFSCDDARVGTTSVTIRVLLTPMVSDAGSSDGGTPGTTTYRIDLSKAGSP